MTTLSDNAIATFDAERVRQDFPILAEQVHGRPLVYMDNAATTQKPATVIDTLDRYYRQQNANVHRGLHALSEKATTAYEEARRSIAAFLHAQDERSIIFTRGCTEAINLVASSWGRQHLKPGDQVLITHMEHHSNIVPWQIICEQTGAKLKVAPVTDRGELDLDEMLNRITEKTKFVSVVHVSNALGTINPAKQIIDAAHAVGAKVLLDGAQAVAHMRVDVTELDCDFYTISGHKMFGPTGIGALYGKFDLLASMPPYQGGGEMIESVRFEKTDFAAPPARFEAGTPHIAGAIGFGAAARYLQSIDRAGAEAHEHELLAHGTRRLSAIEGLTLIGTAEDKAAVLSFTIDGMHPYDLSPLLDHRGIAVRTGHHCTQPLMERFGVSATVRASLGMYNTIDEVDALADSLEEILAEHRRASTTTEPRVAAGDGASEGDEPPFPKPHADSPDTAAKELIDDFEFLPDWEQRYGYIIELGEKLPAMPEHLKTEENRVHGCQSTVHMIARHRPGTADAIDLLADSDSSLVRGLIAVLERLYSGQSAADIRTFDIQGLLKQLGLEQHLTMGRRNGLHSMVQRIHKLAAQLSES
jgi:cysteine desulfurase/selenocysteine lyase